MPSKIILSERNAYNYNGNLIRTLGAHENDKCYAVVAKCGHCGDGYFIPIMFSVFAPNAKLAAETVKDFPRIKRGAKDCILAVQEISFVEYLLIETINNKDEYLTGVITDRTDEDVKRRRVPVPERKEYLAREYGLDKKHVDRSKTADMYDDDCVLQIYFGPIKNGEHYVYPQNPNMRMVLDDYFYANCLRLGIKKKNITTLCMYYQIYGENNPIGVFFDGKNIGYRMGNSVRTIELRSEQIEKILESENNRKIESQSKLTFAQSEKTLGEDLPQKKKQSQTQKFYDRMNKTKQMTESQPGVE